MNAPVNFVDMTKRDPALATLLGAIPGFNFGGNPAAGSRFSAPPMPAPQVGFGDDYGYGFGRHPGHPAGHPAATPAHAHHPLGHGHPDPHIATAARTLALDPNRNSTVKVERYSFSFSPAATLAVGTASTITSFTQQPSASIKGERVIFNIPQENMVLVSALQIANVNVFIGTSEDAANYSRLAQGVYLELPRLDPQNRATCAGTYSGSVPPGFALGVAFTFIATLQGPATLAGGYGQ